MITLYTFGPQFGLPDPSPFVSKAEILLKMSGLPYRANPDGFNKAPKGKLPYLDDDGTIVADSVFIRWHLEKKHGVDFDKGLTAEQKAVAWAAEKLCEDHLYWAIVDSRWMVKANFDKGPRHFFDKAPAPMRPLIIAMINRGVKRTLKGQGFGRHTRPEIERLAAADLDAIAGILGAKPWLTGSQPCGADASVWSSVAGVLCPFFESPIRASAERHANLIAYAQHGFERWYPDLAPKGAKPDRLTSAR